MNVAVAEIFTDRNLFFVCLFVWEFHLFINPPLQMSPNTFRWKLAKIKPFYLSLGYTSISASVKGLKWSKTYLDKALGFMYQTLNTLTFSYISRRFLLALPKKKNLNVVCFSNNSCSKFLTCLNQLEHVSLVSSKTEFFFFFFFCLKSFMIFDHKISLVIF